MKNINKIFQFIIIFLAIGLIIFAFKIKLFSKLGPQHNKNEIIIAFAGDTMLGRMVNEFISKMDSHAKYEYPWGNVLPLLHKTDLNIINLETTLTNSTKIVPKVFNFKASPDKVQILKSGRIDVVNIANNHIKDFDDGGLLETIFVLDQAGIGHVGAGKNILAAQQPIIIEKKGIKIGIIGYTDNEPTWLATENKPGTNYIRVGDLKTIAPQIKSLRDEVDVLIVTCHWGPNKNLRPSPEFVKFAHDLIDLGVDIIHGHSAHNFQGIEIYKNKVILYDTGDFVDDYAVDPIYKNDQSFLFLVKINKNAVIKINKIELLPVKISNMQVNIATGQEYHEILGRMKTLSEELGTHQDQLTFQ